MPIGLLVAFLAISADAADILTLHATSGQFLLAGFYPAYVVFLKGLDPATIKTEWVDKPYKAVLDIKEGPEKGQSVAVELVPTTAASPNPQWCSTEGGRCTKVHALVKARVCLDEAVPRKMRDFRTALDRKRDFARGTSTKVTGAEFHLR